MKNKVFGILLSLLLVLGLGIVPTTLAIADPGLPEGKVVFTQETNGVMPEWSYAEKMYGDYSVKLELPSGYTVADWSHAGIQITTSGYTLNDIESVSYWYYPAEWQLDLSSSPACYMKPGDSLGQAYPASYLVFALDTNSDGVADVWVVQYEAFDTERIWQQDTVNLTTGIFHVEGYTNSLGQNQYTATLADVIASTDVPSGSTVSTLGEATLISVKVDTGGWNASGDYISNPLITYIDDMSINSMPFTLEPNVINTTQNLGYNEIQPAVNGASTGDTINVAAGTYYENVLIDEELIVTGAGASTTTIDGSGTGTVVTITADNVTLSGFTVTNSGSTIMTDCGILLYGNSDCFVRNNIVSNNPGGGIGLFQAQAITVQNNELANNAAAAIALLGSSYNYIYENSCTYTTKPGGTDYGYGIVLDGIDTDIEPDGIEDVFSEGNCFGYNTCSYNEQDGMYFGCKCDSNIVMENTFTNNGNDGIYAWKSSYNDITGNVIGSNGCNGIQLMASKGNTLDQNEINNNDIGILIRSGYIRSYDDGSWIPWISEDNDINYNNISENATYGMEYRDNTDNTDDDAIVINALYNWWGDETGPECAILNINAQGNAVSDNVDFSPWLYAEQENFVSGAPAYAGSVVLDNEATEVEPSSFAGGWNSFSTPVTLANIADTWGELLSLVNESGLFISRVQYFDSASQEWVLAVTGNDVASGYEDDGIEPCIGYFIQVKTAGSIPVLCNTGLSSPPMTNLNPGWNLVGLSSLDAISVDTALSGIDYSVARSAAPPNNQSWNVPTGNPAETMMCVGEAYWVAVSNSEILFGYTTTPVSDDMTWDLNKLA